jgi:biotin carboxylase
VRLLLVSPSGSYRVAAFLDAAEAVGAEVVVATDVVSAIPGSSVYAPFDDPDAAARQLVDQAGPVDGVVGTDGAAVAVAAAVGRRLGLIANPVSAIAAAGDKWAQRCAAATAGVPQPECGLVTGDDGDGWTAFPAVVKPLDRSASQGVVRVDDAGAMGEAVRRVREIVEVGAPLVVERYVPGFEVAVEGLVSAGRLEVLAVFDKPDTPEGPTFPETLLISPARLAPEVAARVVDVATSAVAAVGLVEGPVHVECKVDGDDVWFLELAARTIGGLCSQALDLGGVSLEELVVRHALGLPVPARGPSGATGVLMLPVERSGRLVAVRGVEQARAVDGVTGVTISIGAGQEVLALPAGDRYLGFVFARAATADVVELALRRAWAALDVEITVS